MSDTNNQDEPMIIKTDRPHSVSMSEGSNVAVGKKAEASEPAIRKVLAEGEKFGAEENNVIDGGQDPDKGPNKDVIAKGENYKGHQNVADAEENFKGYQSAADGPDRFASQPKDAPIPPAISKPIDVTKLDSILKTKEEAVEADTVSNEAEVLAAVAVEKPIAKAQPMPEMNFPARVIKVKIENEQVRQRLDKLEE
jgi:hypothetical protein